MKHIVIVVGGSIDDEMAADLIRKEQPDVCMAADSGMNFFYRNRICPDVIVGDFDSVSSEALEYFKTIPDIEWKVLNPVKDDTDTESAIRLAIEQGAERITLLGATGTRLDHVLGNIELLGIGLQQHVPIEMIDSHNRIRMIDSGVSLSKDSQYGKYVSLIPYTQEVTGLTLTGFQYPLDGYTLRGFCSLGVSNEITEETAQISFKDGILLLIESRD